MFSKVSLFMRTIIGIVIILFVSSECFATQYKRDILTDSIQQVVDSNVTVEVNADNVHINTSYASNIEKELSCKNEVEAMKTSLMTHSLKTDMTWWSLPWLATDIALRHERKQIKSIRQKFQYDFYNETDDYLQYSPLLLSTGLKIAGVEGRSNWSRYLVSATASYAVMALLVNSIKYSVREQRPDGSSYNSFPSGHTATAFAAATILHKEYGLTRSPWYSIGGYLLATATGCMRVLNNRHWISDTFMGAGIGILSTELGYTIGDLVFKQKGLQRPNLKNTAFFSNQPSFFSVQIGVGLGEQKFNVMKGSEVLKEDFERYRIRTLKLSRALSVGSEGAFFFNQHIGVGGRLRVVSCNVKNWSDLAQYSIYDLKTSLPRAKEVVDDYSLTVESNHMAEFSASGGLYLNIPLSRYLSLGSKLLLGRSYVQGVKITADVSGHQRDLDFSIKQNGGKEEFVCNVLGDKEDNGKAYATSWDFLRISANNAFTIGTGFSFNYAYKSLMVWRLFLDYDFCCRTYFMHYDPSAFLKDAARNVSFEGSSVLSPDRYVLPHVKSLKRNMSQFILGAAFSISF